MIGGADLLSLESKPEHDPEGGRGRERSTGLNRRGNMAHTRAADDFQAIRARIEELRREREGAAGTETACGSVELERRRNNAIFVSFRRLLKVAGRPLAVPDGS